MARVKFTREDAKKELPFAITEKHIEEGRPMLSYKCVICVALFALFKGKIKGIQVGSSTTKIHFPRNRIVRYKTPYGLSHSLRLFDKTSNWHLPPGMYRLLPYKDRSGLSWRPAKRERNAMRDLPGVPTRNAKNVFEMMHPKES